jgi:hypothetical protein
MAPPENWFQGFRHHFLKTMDPVNPAPDDSHSPTTKKNKFADEHELNGNTGEQWTRLEEDWQDLEDEWNEIDKDLQQYYESPQSQQGRESLDQEGWLPDQAEDHCEPECWHQGFRHHFTSLTDFQHHPARPAQNLRLEGEDYHELVRPSPGDALQLVDRDEGNDASIVESNNHKQQASLLQWLLWPFRAVLEALFAMSG